jgi:nucleoside diphosphate kinase
MAKELAFVLINPYTIAKSRTGGVIGRYMCRTDLDLVAARMFAPSKELVELYSGIIRCIDPAHAQTNGLIADYIQSSYSPDPDTGKPRRVMMLLFEGDDAVRKIWEVTGSATLKWGSGETVRDTYGDYVPDTAGRVKYFEPAVLVAPNSERAALTLSLWARFGETMSVITEMATDVPQGEQVEKTLVMLKPDNFRFPSSRPGNIIDILSSSGLRIVAVKKFSMSVAQAEEFYGPVRESLTRKFSSFGAKRAVDAMSREFGFAVPEQAVRPACEEIAPMFALQQFEEIVKFMTGYRPSEVSESEKAYMGREGCLALVYEGLDAVRKIRALIGVTDPSLARPGSVRREYGRDVMVNAAHASDSVENAVRELKIIRIEEDTIKKMSDKYFGDMAARLSAFPPGVREICRGVLDGGK